MWKFSTFSEFAFYALLLLALPPIVNSKEIPTPGMCAFCLDPRCATIVTKSFPANSNSRIKAWWKGSSQIPMCSKDSLMPDAPCKMANGSLVQPANEKLHFEGVDSSGEWHTFPSVNMPCAERNLPPNSTLSPVIQAPIHNVPTPAAPKDSVADNKGSGSGIGIGGGIGIFFGIVIVILIGVLIWKRKSCGQGQDGDHRHGNNGVLPHDTEHRDEITIEMQPLKGEVANENVNGVH